MPRGGDTDGDAALRAAGLTRAMLAARFRVTPQRIGQIFRGEGAGYYLADEIASYINHVAGRRVCDCDMLMIRPKYIDKGRQPARKRKEAKVSANSP